MNQKFSSGFSLLEVLIAVVVLSVGLLGMALLQTISLNSGESANYRTKATNLSAEILDVIRANKSQIGNYPYYLQFSNFTDVSATSGNCAPGATVTGDRAEQDSKLWVCAVRRTLPNGEGNIDITAPTAGNPGRITVSLRWMDDRSQSTADDQWTGDSDFDVTTNI